MGEEGGGSGGSWERRNGRCWQGGRYGVGTAEYGGLARAECTELARAECTELARRNVRSWHGRNVRSWNGGKEGQGIGARYGGGMDESSVLAFMNVHSRDVRHYCADSSQLTALSPSAFMILFIVDFI